MTGTKLTEIEKDAELSVHYGSMSGGAKESVVDPLIAEVRSLQQQVNTLQHDVAVYKKALESSTDSLIAAEGEVNTLTEALVKLDSYLDFSDTDYDGCSVEWRFDNSKGIHEAFRFAHAALQSIKEQKP